MFKVPKVPFVIAKAGRIRQGLQRALKRSPCASLESVEESAEEAWKGHEDVDDGEEEVVLAPQSQGVVRGGDEVLVECSQQLREEEEEEEEHRCKRSRKSGGTVSDTVQDEAIKDAYPLCQSLQPEVVIVEKKELGKYLCFAVEEKQVMGSQYFISGYSAWKEFEHKQMAMQEIAEERRRARLLHSQGGFLPLWGKQVTAQGSQTFVVANFRLFYNVYQNMPDAERVFYEMIQPNALVKLYVDYDAESHEMSAGDFEARVRVLNQIIEESVYQIYGTHAKRVELRSNSQQKLSVHCIWILNSGLTYFASVTDVKAFIQYVGLIAHRRFPWWIPEKSRRICGILDMAVYKPGAYRLIGSTKLGQQRQLVPRGGHQDESETIFFDSLLQHFPWETCVTAQLTCSVHKDGLALAGTAKAQDGNHLRLVLGSNADEYRQARSGINGLPLSLLVRILALASMHPVCSLVCKRWYQALTGNWMARKPDPVLASAFQRLCMAVNDAPVTDWLYHEGWFGRCYVINQKSHNCEMNQSIKQRAHLRNTIYWVFLVDQRVYYQKCHDVDCKQYCLLCQTFACLEHHHRPGTGTPHDIPDNVLFVHSTCSPQSPSSAQQHEQLTRDRLYDNRRVTIRVGDSVKFYGDSQCYHVRSIQGARATLRHGKGTIISIKLSDLDFVESVSWTGIVDGDDNDDDHDDDSVHLYDDEPLPHHPPVSQKIVRTYSRK